VAGVGKAPAARLDGVSKWYLDISEAGPRPDGRVLDRVSLDLKLGDFLYVVGGSGAGKSSLLRLLATEETPSSGSLSLFGFDLTSAPPSKLQSIRRNIGYVPQNIRLIPDLTVFDNVVLSLSLAGKRVGAAAARQRVTELLERLGLAAKKEKMAAALSGGEAQRVAIARALVRQPQLLVADEPTGAQDKDFTWAVMDLFLKANLSGTTVVVATHDREIVRRVRKRCATLKNGQLVAEDGLCTY
jgi:cell division transport system ATP-binding protein